jgi:hypothetical protein
LATIGAIGWWIYAKHPTLSGFVDTLTRPILGTSAAVGGSERKRVMGEASQVVALEEGEKPIGAVHKGMSDSEVRRLLGEPDEIQAVEADGSVRFRWLYRGVGRVVVFERRRVVSIAVL